MEQAMLLCIVFISSVIVVSFKAFIILRLRNDVFGTGTLNLAYLET